jgi:uncharacterized BrkB/YihY/UPF0761 family membrane protein
MQITTLWHMSQRVIQDWWNDNCLRLAASLAYYTALSLAPLILLIVGVVGLVLDRQQAIHLMFKGVARRNDNFLIAHKTAYINVN